MTRGPHGAALWLLLAAGTAHAEQELPTYPGVVHTRIGNDLVINGAYYRIAYFKTQDPLRVVADYFFQYWKKEGYPTVVEGDGRDEVTVSAFYTREGLSRSVVLRRHGDLTLGFSVLNDLWVAPQGPPPEPPVKLEGTLYAADSRAVNEGGNNTSYTQIVDGALVDLRGRVIDQMQKQGFSMIRAYGGDGQGAKQQFLEFSSPQKQVLVTLTEADPQTVVVSQLELGAFGNQNRQLPLEKAKKPGGAKP